MKKTITLIYVVFITSLLIVGCSELETNITSATSPGVHGEGVLNINSPNFHGNYFVKMKFIDCQNCHAKNFGGGLTTVSCAAAGCHPAIDIHSDSAGVMNPSSRNFHGRYLLTNSLVDCQQCHGENFAGGLTSPSCATCHSAISVHQSGIIDQASPNFHGKNPLTKNFSDCQQCHGENFTGGISSPSCLKCHSAISVHQVGIIDSTSSSFHGKNPLTKNLVDCQSCHGKSFAGGTLSPSCVGCHSAISVHQEGILTPSSSDFHGKYLLTDGFKNCQQCHGNNFTGGTLSPSCVTCHAGITVHKEGIINQTSPDFHGKFIANMGWNLQNCSQCHGVSYSGGTQSPTCLTCHNQPAGPEACNTCHGDFNDPLKIAPPRDLSGNTLTTFKGVGAHSNHLYNNSLGSEVKCETCHTVPQSFASAGHIDGSLPAEVSLKGLAIINSASNANYNYSNVTCSNTYCHGNFEFQKDSAYSGYQFVYTGTKIQGNNRSVIWNKVDGTELVCGTCHGLPPTGHLDFGGLSTCVNCHSGVVNAQGQIIDPTKHINGVKNVFGN